MNKLITTFIGATLAAASVSAFAGPDWYVIEKARQAKQVEAKQAEAPAPSPQVIGPRSAARIDQQDPVAKAAMMKECADMTQMRK